MSCLQQYLLGFTSQKPVNTKRVLGHSLSEETTFKTRPTFLTQTCRLRVKHSTRLSCPPLTANLQRDLRYFIT